MQTIVFHTATHPQFPDFVQCVSYNSLTEGQEIFYSTFGIAALYIIPLVIIICCYTRILWEIYKRSKESTEGKTFQYFNNLSINNLDHIVQIFKVATLLLIEQKWKVETKLATVEIILI